MHTDERHRSRARTSAAGQDDQSLRDSSSRSPMRERLRRFLRTAPLRIVIGAIFLLGAVVAREVLLGLLRVATGFRHPPRLWLAPGDNRAVGASDIGYADIGYAWLGATLMIALGLGAYRLFVKWLERGRPVEVARPFAAESAFGSLIGAGLVFAIAGTLALSGHFRVIGSNAWHFSLIPLAAAATAAVMEELCVRGL